MIKKDNDNKQYFDINNCCGKRVRITDRKKMTIPKKNIRKKI